MCIRDRPVERERSGSAERQIWLTRRYPRELLPATDMLYRLCLLYTSDAADERSSVDLGGRRIIKKKKNEEKWDGEEHQQKHKNNM